MQPQKKSSFKNPFMRVELLKHTDEPEKVVALAARLCYSKISIKDLEGSLSPDYAEKLVRKILSLGHLSVLEHVSFTFGIEGISRAASHQLVRHRIASYSQQSQRYVDYNNLEVVTPHTVNSDSAAKERFEEVVGRLEDFYRWMIERGIPVEDARYILPNATTTRLIMTMNGRELNHFFTLRGCMRAQWEIRDLAKEMLRKVKNVAPVIFEGSGPGCVGGACSEGEFSCGRAVEVREEFRNL